jgi:hypothetical protein
MLFRTTGYTTLHSLKQPHTSHVSPSSHNSHLRQHLTQNLYNRRPPESIPLTMLSSRTQPMSHARLIACKENATA